MIHVLFTGGTISMRHDAQRGGNVPEHGGAELLALSGVPAGIECTAEDWARSPACHLDAARLWALRQRVREIMRQHVASGIVITHGTDVLEETAYLLARTLPAECPVVITGAMRTADHPDWDGARNLRDAMRVAADRTSRDRGVMVAFAGKILGGLDAAKMHATDPDAFAAPHAEPLGAIVNDAVHFDRAPTVRPVLEPEALERRVVEIPAVLGDDGALLDLARADWDGAVLTAFGSGNVPPGMVPAIRRWIDAGKPVVLASRCACGSVTPTYAFDGGGAQLVRSGVIPAGARTPAQARMELMIALSAGVEYGAGL